MHIHAQCLSLPRKPCHSGQTQVTCVHTRARVRASLFLATETLPQWSNPGHMRAHTHTHIAFPAAAGRASKGQPRAQAAPADSLWDVMLPPSSIAAARAQRRNSDSAAMESIMQQRAPLGSPPPLAQRPPGSSARRANQPNNHDAAGGEGVLLQTPS